MASQDLTANTEEVTAGYSSGSNQSGPTVALDAEEVTPSGLFRQFIGDDLLDEVAVETNRYAGTEG